MSRRLLFSILYPKYLLCVGLSIQESGSGRNTGCIRPFCHTADFDVVLSVLGVLQSRPQHFACLHADAAAASALPYGLHFLMKDEVLCGQQAADATMLETSSGEGEVCSHLPILLSRVIKKIV